MSVSLCRHYHQSQFWTPFINKYIRYYLRNQQGKFLVVGLVQPLHKRDRRQNHPFREKR